MDLFKKSPWQPSLTEANILKRYNLTKKYMKIDFFKVSDEFISSNI